MGVMALDGAADGRDGPVELDAVDRALDDLADVRFHDLSLAEQAIVVSRLVHLRSRLEGIEAAALAAFEAGGEWALDGHRSADAALSHRCRVSRAEARRRVRLARRLRDCPHVADALVAGDITTEHARLLVAARRPPVVPEFERDEALLVAQARTLSYADLTVAVRYWSNRVDPAGDEAVAVQAEQAAHAYISRTFDDMVRVDAWLDPIGGTAFLTAVGRIEDELFRADWQEAAAVHGADTTTAHLARTSGQRRAAALVELAVRAGAAPADGKRPLPLVNVVIDSATFESALCRRAGLPTGLAPSGPCQVADGPVLTPSQAIELALAGHVRRVVYDTANIISDISPKRRFFTGTLRDLLEVRDRHCTQPGCDQPGWRCEGDHIEPYDAVGGNTTAANGRLLCRYHHRMRQRLRYPPTATRQADGTLQHKRADGTRIADASHPPWEAPGDTWGGCGSDR